MRVDFYQLGPRGHDGVIGSLAGKLLGEEQRLLVVADDEALLARLDRMLWDEGAASFLPHGLAGGTDDSRQPILLATTTDAPNLARNILIADGEWRDAANQIKSPAAPLGGAMNTVTFNKVTTPKLRVVFTHQGKARSGLTELELWKE